MSNINKYFNKISNKRDLSGESNSEEYRKKSKKEVPQSSIMMALRMKYSNRSAQEMIFEKC